MRSHLQVMGVRASTSFGITQLNSQEIPSGVWLCSAHTHPLCWPIPSCLPIISSSCCDSLPLTTSKRLSFKILNDLTKIWGWHKKNSTQRRETWNWILDMSAFQVQGPQPLTGVLAILCLNSWPTARLWDLIVLRWVFSISVVSSPQCRALSRRNTKSINIKINTSQIHHFTRKTLS